MTYLIGFAAGVTASIAGKYLWQKFCVVPEDERDFWGME